MQGPQWVSCVPPDRLHCTAAEVAGQQQDSLRGPQVSTRSVSGPEGFAVGQAPCWCHPHWVALLGCQPRTAQQQNRSRLSTQLTMNLPHLVDGLGHAVFETAAQLLRPVSESKHPAPHFTLLCSRLYWWPTLRWVRSPAVVYPASFSCTRPQPPSVLANNS